MILKTKGFKRIALLAATGLMTVNCDYVKELNYQVLPDPLEMHGDSVRVKVEIEVPEKSFNRKVYAEIQPSLGDRQLKPITFAGEKATANGVVVPFKSGKTVVYTDVVAYDESMRNTDLSITGDVFKKDKAKGEIKFQKISDATIVTPYLKDIGFGPGRVSENGNSKWFSSAAVDDCQDSKSGGSGSSGSGPNGSEVLDAWYSISEATGNAAEIEFAGPGDRIASFNSKNGEGDGYRVIRKKDNFVRSTTEKFTAQINYLKGRYEVRSSEIREADIDSLMALLSETENNTKLSVKGMEITAYASIEGEEDKNNTLSENRAQSAKEAIMKLSSKTRSGNSFGKEESSYSTFGKGEDFEGFRMGLAKADMDEADKRAIVTILDMQRSKEAKEQAIRDLNTYLYLDKNVFPAQRRAEIVTIYDKIGYSDDELISLSKTDLNKLNLEELLRAASLMRDDEDKIRIYKNAESRFPDDNRASNNLGVLYFENGDLDKAKEQFEKAALVNGDNDVKNNLAAIAAMEGDYEKAHMLLDEAAGAGSEVNYNRAIINMAEGDYKDAISNFGGETSYNLGLAQLLDGDPDGAINTIDNLPEIDCGYGSYIKAIAYARKDDLNNVIKNLKAAFRVNASLKQAAATDAEFSKYEDEAAFTAIIK